MAIADGRTLILLSSIIISFIPSTFTVGIPGICADDEVSCMCGNQKGSYPFNVRVERCVRFHRWKQTCKPCDEISDEQRCSPYGNCEECQSSHIGCIKCPLGFYGSRCQLTCTCHNGASCDINTGQCICPPGYNPPDCIRASCSPLPHPNKGNYTPVKSDYNVGETIIFTCEPEHSLTGQSHLRCEQNSQWNGSPPTCSNTIIKRPSAQMLNMVLEDIGKMENRFEEQLKVLTQRVQQLETQLNSMLPDDNIESRTLVSSEIKVITCSKPESLQYGAFAFLGVSVGNLKITPGSTAIYSCNQGYTLIGETKLTCKCNGQWSSKKPICIYNQPKEQQCPSVAAPLHGSVQQPSPATEGSTLTYACNTGYQLLGEKSRTCNHGGNWNGVESICEKVITCSKPESLLYGSYAFLGVGVGDLKITPGSTVIYSCNQGYTLIGETKLTCESNGGWSSEKPICLDTKNVCLHPGPVINGETTVIGQGNELAVPKNSSLEFKCKPLHYMVGVPRITCQSNGTWSSNKPVCFKLTTCPAVEGIKNGGKEVYLPHISIDGNTNTFRVASLPGRVMDSRIGGGIRFRTSLQNETVEARAAILQTTLPSGYFHVGTRIVFSCESRYYEMFGSRIRTCTSKGEWSGRQPTCVPICGRSSAPRMSFITHGEVSPLGQWPWQVAISRRVADGEPGGPWHLICGGALISEHLVLTAAHCLTYSGMTEAVPSDEFLLSFGKHYRNKSRDDGDVQRRKISEMIIHEDYEPTTFESDIALLKLVRPVTLTSRVQPICLPDINNPDSSNSRVKIGHNGTISGWGKDENGNLSEELRHAQVEVVDSEKCEDDYRSIGIPLIVSSNMFCAGYEKGHHDSCSGDSGGPMVFPITNRKDSWVLEGLVSWGSPRGCGNPNQYGGYVRVQRFVEWITKNE